MKIIKTADYHHDFSLLLAKDQKLVNTIENKIEAADDPTSLDFTVKKSPLPELDEYSIAVSGALVFITFKIENNKCVLVDVV